MVCEDSALTLQMGIRNRQRTDLPNACIWRPWRRQGARRRRRTLIWTNRDDDGADRRRLISQYGLGIPPILFGDRWRASLHQFSRNEEPILTPRSNIRYHRNSAGSNAALCNACSNMRGHCGRYRNTSPYRRGGKCHKQR